MDSNQYSNYSLEELYKLYTKMNQENNTTEAQLIYDQIIIKEKSNKEKDIAS